MLDVNSAKNWVEFALYSSRDVALWEYDIEDHAYLHLLRLKWHTYHIEFHPDEDCLIFGTTFTKEIGNELYQYMTLVDLALNQFEVVVDQICGKLCVTHGIEELHKTYNLEQRAWMYLINVQPQLFVIRVLDRHDYEIKYPMYVSPLRLELDRSIYNADASPGFTGISLSMPYHHGSNCFKYAVTKWLTLAYVESDHMTFTYAIVFENIVHKDGKEIHIIDDSGHYWLFMVTILHDKDEINFGGDWKLFSNARKLYKM